MTLYLKIFYESIQLAFQQLSSNKLRSFLSLLGITIGIFCIIAVQSAVDSLENSIKSGLGELGSDIVMVDVMPWDEDPGDNYWKYLKRPSPSYADFEAIKKKSKATSFAAYTVYINGKTIKYRSSSVQGAFIMGTTESFPEVQNIQIDKGRLFTPKEYETAANKVILGAKIVDELFGTEEAVGKYVKLFGQKFQIIGVLKEEGDNPFNFLNYDEATWIAYNTMKKFVNMKSTNRFSTGKILYAKTAEGYDIDELKDDVTGVLRAQRRLKPAEGDNFSLNELSMLTNMIDSVFGIVNWAGWIIGFFALLVGMISVANIMFVSVKERTNIIGIKKALGAKNFVVLLEFLIEAIILCIVGGIMGLVFVYFILKIISGVIPIELWLSPNNAIVGIGASVIVGLLAGVIPALLAARMDPVVAIRQG